MNGPVNGEGRGCRVAGGWPICLRVFFCTCSAGWRGRKPGAGGTHPGDARGRHDCTGGWRARPARPRPAVRAAARASAQRVCTAPLASCWAAGGRGRGAGGAGQRPGPFLHDRPIPSAAAGVCASYTARRRRPPPPLGAPAPASAAPVPLFPIRPPLVRARSPQPRHGAVCHRRLLAALSLTAAAAAVGRGRPVSLMRPSPLALACASKCPPPKCASRGTSSLPMPSGRL